jgi:AraC family transcriptional regulator of adaptative response/methylated-DNA-[protein]-cysteine methyltransferase
LAYSLILSEITAMLTDEIKYKAFLGKDTSFEGLFFVAVKTTGIFCRVGCTARTPKKENIEFFENSKDAMAHGYRACKVCSPLEKSGATPEYISTLLKELSENPSVKINDAALRSKGIEPSTIRRWFKKNHGITFQAYQRMLRINSAFTKIQSGETVTATAFESGYESLSGFAESFKSTIGVAPSQSKNKMVITITRFETPLGPMFTGATEEGICLLEFTDRRMLETEFGILSKKLNATILQGMSKYGEQIIEQLTEYFDGKRKEFTVPLHLIGTPFQKKVWQELLRIPYGTTRSYKQQSLAINNPGAIRAVGTANGMNMIAIVVPCHRVIGEDGTLTGYGGGLWRKKWLLDLEKGQLTLGALS